MNKKILIIDDEELIAGIFKKQLSFIGKFDVDHTNSSYKGLEMMRDKKYDVLLLDLVIPDFDGVQILEVIKTEPEKYHFVKVIVLTNVTSTEIKEKASKLGVEYYINKVAITPEKLIAIIKKATLKSSLGEKIRKYRKRAGLSQLGLEVEISASPGSVSRIENNQINPTKETLAKIEKVLKLSTSEILDLYRT